MKKNIITFIFILVGILIGLCLAPIFIPSKYLIFNEKDTLNYLIGKTLGQPQVIAAIITVLGVGITAIITTINYKSISYGTIHESTNWRGNLMDIASKEYVTINDVYRVQASISPSKKDNGDDDLDILIHKEINKILQSNTIYRRFDIYQTADDFSNLNLVDEKLLILKNKDDREKIRKISRYLLKANWIANAQGNSRRKNKELIDSFQKDFPIDDPAK